MIDPTAPRLTSLKKYAQHFECCFALMCSECGMDMHDNDFDEESDHECVPNPCTCGLDALLSVPSPQPETSRTQVIEKLTKAASWETGPLETKQLIDEALALLQQEGTT